MLKRSLVYGVFLFVSLTLWQFAFHWEVQWLMVLSVSILAGLFNLLWDWAKVPFEWKKRNGQ